MLQRGIHVFGVSTSDEAVRCCVELRLQIYNTKLHLPSSRSRRFGHLDCDWKRGGCCTTPAPQCIVATSPDVVLSKRVYSVQFVDVAAEVQRKFDQSHSHARLKHGQETGASNSPANTTNDPSANDSCEPSAGAQHRKKPYRLPRLTGGINCGRAIKEPPSTDYDRDGTGPDRIEVGDVLFFGHLTAHQFTQHATLTAPPAKQSSSLVPLGWTRTAEYPTLVAPHFHGEPHQSVSEVLAALCSGALPQRWAHVYTGNSAPACTAFFQPALPPLAAVPSTPLARTLVGIDDFSLFPQSIAWLLEGQSGDKAERAAIRLHKRLMLTEMISTLQRRSRRLATHCDDDLLDMARTQSQEYTQRSVLATSVTNAVSAAAYAITSDPSVTYTGKTQHYTAKPLS